MNEVSGINSPLMMLSPTAWLRLPEGIAAECLGLAGGVNGFTVFPKSPASKDSADVFPLVGLFVEKCRIGLILDIFALARQRPNL